MTNQNRSSSSSNSVSNSVLSRSLGTVQLWSIAVGLVISGEYFGWSLGWAHAGTLGFLISTVFIAAVFTAFIFSFTELTTAIPNAGGPFTYATRAFGPYGGYFAGVATLVQYVFTPPTIALAIGGYLAFQFPGLHEKTAALATYAVFMTLNILGVRVAAAFELIVTVLAIFELIVFMIVVSPGFHWANFVHGGWGGHSAFGLATFPGIFASLPFAIWFFGCIDGVAMAAEEARDPHRAIPRAYLTAIATLVTLAFGVMIFAGGAGDWTRIASKNAPLPEAMRIVVGQKSGWLHMLVWMGLFGLVASFHGIIIGYSRQIFAQAREGFLPGFLADVNVQTKTPHWAILSGGAVGIATIYAVDWIAGGKSNDVMSDIAVLTVFGMMVMYAISLFALFRLRITEPGLHRPFRAPLYPALPMFALIGVMIALVSMVWAYPWIAVAFFGVLAIGLLIFRLRAVHRPALSPPVELGAVTAGEEPLMLSSEGS